MNKIGIYLNLYISIWEEKYGDKMVSTVKHLPSTWEKLLGIQIRDRDGWLCDNRSWDTPITEYEFKKRSADSTIGCMPPSRSYTKEQFIEIIECLAPKVTEGCKAARLALPETVKAVAVYCFIHRPNGHHEFEIEILREYLKKLEETGMFGFDKE